MTTLQMEHIFLPYGASRVHVLKMGHGKATLLAFHGFSEKASGFKQIMPALADTYTVYAFDFPFHGQTDWQEKADFTVNELITLIDQLASREQFTAFALMGFSMGGRLCLRLVAPFRHRLTRIFLIAADGIRTHKVFDIAMYPVWGRWLFRWVMQRPHFFFRVVGILYRSRLISRFLYEFAHNHMDTKEKRQRIFYTWVSLKNFSPPVAKVQALLVADGIPVHLFFGARDEVIRPEVGEAFCKHVPQATFDLIPKGHQLVHPVLIPYLQKYV